MCLLIVPHTIYEIIVTYTSNVRGITFSNHMDRHYGMDIFRVDHVGIPTLILIVWLIGRSRLRGDSAARLRIAEALGEELCRLELGGADPRNRLQFN